MDEYEIWQQVSGDVDVLLAGRKLDYTDEVAGDPTEQLYQFYLNASRQAMGPAGSRGDEFRTLDTYLGALRRSAEDREGARMDPLTREYVRSRPENTSPMLRDAQHGLVAKVRTLEDPWGKTKLLAEVPVYNAGKAVAQNILSASGIPAGLDALAQYYLREDEQPLTNASKPSLQSIKWGLRPFWGKD